MINSLEHKVSLIVAPAAIKNNSSYTCSKVDAKGFNWVDIYILLGATDIALSALSLTESDDDNSDYVAVPNSDFSTALHADGTAATLPSATDDNKFFAIRVNMHGRKRYLKPVITVGNGTAGGFVASWAVLSRPEITPTDATGRGVAQEVYPG